MMSAISRTRLHAPNISPHCLRGLRSGLEPIGAVDGEERAMAPRVSEQKLDRGHQGCLKFTITRTPQLRNAAEYPWIYQANKRYREDTVIGS